MKGYGGAPMDIADTYPEFKIYIMSTYQDIIFFSLIYKYIVYVLSLVIFRTIRA